MLKLDWPRFISPTWRHSISTEGVVVDEVTVVANGDKLTLLEGTMPSIGTTLLVVAGRRYLTAETQAEYEHRIAAQHALRMQESIERARLEKWQDAEREHLANIANQQLNIPVRWTSGQKIVLSGLSERSDGSGRNARSVVHVLLLEPLNDKRLSRSANSFLCTTPSGSDGKDYTDRLDTRSAGVNGSYVSQVTCQQCLKIAKRWRGAS